MKELFFYEVQDRITGTTEANLIECVNLQVAELAVFTAAIKTKFNVIQIWNMDVAGEMNLSPMVYNNPKSH